VKDTTARDRGVVSVNKEKEVNAVMASECWVWKAKNSSASNNFKKYSYIDARGRSKSIMAWIPKRSLILLFYVHGNPQQKEYKEKEVIDSGCSRHMTVNKCYLTEYEDYDGGFVSFEDGKGTRDNIVAGQAKKKTEPEQEYILIPFCIIDPLISQGPKDSEEDVGMKPTDMNEIKACDKGEEDEQDTRSNAVGPSFTNDNLSSPVNAAEASNAFEDHLFE
ncbi:hypothetical protein Tco_0048140, partial [Tanacetum coccineum]